MALLAGGLALPVAALGQVLQAPNGAPAQGELGFLLGGAFTALASGAEALWFNPAGLALEAGAHLTAGGSLLRLREVAAGGPSGSAWDSALGGIAYAQGLDGRRRFPHFAFGFSLALTADQRLASRFALTRTGPAASLPPGFTAPGGALDTTFPAGLTLTDAGEALGELRILAPGAGLAVAPAQWLRVGAALQLERVSLAQWRSGITTVSASEGATTLAGRSQLAWVLRGEAVRLSTSLGVQVEVTRTVVLGLALVLPGDTLQGVGRLLYQRSDAAAINGGAPTVASVSIDRDGLPFRLEAQRRLQAGLAWRGDRFLVELDLYRLAALGSYPVLPATQSQPPSTLTLELPALTTSGRAVLGGAIGMAYAQSPRTSLALAIAADPSPVPPEDPLFRAVDSIAVTAGVYHVRGDLSVALGAVYRETRGSAVAFPPPDGGAPLHAVATVQELTLQAGGSLAF